MKTVAARCLVVLLGLAVLATPAAGLSQTQVPQIGYLLLGDAESSVLLREAFSDGLRELGYADGRNVALEFRYAAGDPARLAQNAQDLVRSNVKVIVTASTPAFLAAQKATSTIPIVFATIADPVAAGFVESLSRPGRNFTGLTILSEELNAKRLELIKQIAPKAKRIGLLENPDNPSTVRMASGIMPAAASLGLTILSFDIRGPDGYEAAFDAMAAKGVDAVLVLDDATFNSSRAALVAAATARKLPLICPYPPMADAGCLCSYGVNYLENYRRSAAYVDKILKGANPGELPVENPRQFETVVNLQVAAKLGLTIPEFVRLRADRLIR
jgi:putative ABC transport system substrate-binding protein